MVWRAEVLYCIGVPVVSGSYSRDGGSVEGEVAIVVQHLAAGSMFEGAEDGVQVLGPGLVPVLRALVVRTIPGYEVWTNWGPNGSCRTPAQDGFV